MVFSAYLLVFHGSHDSRSQTAATSLTESFRQKIRHIQPDPSAWGQDLHQAMFSSALPQPDPVPVGATTTAQPEAMVQDAYLECVSLPLHRQIEQFAQQVRSRSATLDPIHLVVIPIFLLAGVHVAQDIGAEVALAQQALGQTATLTIAPHLGTQVGLRRLLSERMSSLPVEAWILLSHGSRRRGANRSVQELAELLGAIAAFWSTAPNLETRLQELNAAGIRRVGILPYFLFPGSITDVIAQSIDQLSHQFPHLSLTLVEPLNATPELADLIINLVPDLKISGASRMTKLD